MRWVCFGILAIVFLLGSWNVVLYLIIESRWRAFPLTLIYICAQSTLIFAMARLPYPVWLEETTFSLNYLYIKNLSLACMLSLGLAQILTLLELAIKTSKITLLIK